MLRVVAILIACVALFVLAACEPQIGDECEANLDCPAGAVCDITAPGGYCLIQGCEDNADCPEEAVGVAFNDYTTFCLLACTSSSDCRGGYACRDIEGYDSFCYVAADADADPFARAKTNP
jgi:hypothetical protein